MYRKNGTFNEGFDFYFLLRFHWKKFVKLTYLIRFSNKYELLLRNMYVNIKWHWLQCYSVEKYGISLPRFFRNFPSNQRFTKELYSKLIWRKKFAWQWISRFSTPYFCNFHTVDCLLRFTWSQFWQSYE